MSQAERVLVLGALIVAKQIITAMLPMQEKYGAGIGPKEQSDLAVIDAAIKLLKGKS